MSKVAVLSLVTVLWLGTVKCCMGGNPLPKKSDSKRIKSYTAQLSEFIQLDEHINLPAVVSKYLNYGCFCGWGGMGNTPIDESDACCQSHDDCYNKIETNGKINLDPPFLNALAQSSNKVKNLALIILTYQYDYDQKTKKATCSEHQSATKLAKCKCDYALGHCLSTNLKTYNSKYDFMDKNPQVCPTRKNS